MDNAEGFRLVPAENLQLHDNFAQSLWKGVFHSTIQTPINGAVQLTDRVLGTEFLPKVQIMDAPDRSSIGNKIAGGLGSLIGTSIHVSAMLYVGGKLGGSELTRAGFKNRALATGLLGAAYGGVFSPVANDDGNFWATRGERALVGGTALALMSPMHAMASNMGMPKEAWIKPTLKDFTAKPLLFTAVGITADCLAPSNWSKLQWWPDVDMDKKRPEPNEDSRPKGGTFIRRPRPISELQ